MFKLEIDCLEDFIVFVNIIRGEDFDLEKVKALTKELNKDANKLEKAIDESKKGV